MIQVWSTNVESQIKRYPGYRALTISYMWTLGSTEDPTQPLNYSRVHCTWQGTNTWKGVHHQQLLEKHKLKPRDIAHLLEGLKEKKTDKDFHEIHNNTVMLETVRQCLVKLNIHLPHNLANAFLDIIQMEWTYVHTKLQIWMFAADHFIPFV